MPFSLGRTAVLTAAVFVAGMPRSMPAQGIPVQGIPPQGIPPQGIPPQGMLVGQPELNWAQKMFSPALKHDFGSVAKGADVRCQFTITNIYKERVEIRNPRSSCGCGKPTLVDPKNPAVQTSAVMLETNESAALVVQIDTIGHDRAKTPTISVDITFYADTGAYSKVVDIPITVYIRPDLVMTPGAADFGNLDIGAGGERQINIAYAGAESWKILDVKSGNPNVQPTLVQLNRGAGRVDYMLTIRVAPNTPEGALREQLQLVTNDLNSPNVPYLVRANITPEFQVIPPVVKFGTLKPGVKKTVSVIVKGKTPFKIEQFECESNRRWFQAGRAPEARTIHRVEITVDPPNEPGPVKETFLATIEGRQVPIKFAGEAVIAPADAAPAVSPMGNAGAGGTVGP